MADCSGFRWRNRRIRHTIAGEKNESRKETIEGRLVAIIKEITDEGELHKFIEWNIKVNDIRTKYNEGRPEEKKVASQWIGKRLQHMSIRHRRIHGYTEIIINSNEYNTILKQYGYAGRELIKPANAQLNSLPEKDEQNQPSCTEVESGRESAHAGGSFDFNSPTEKNFVWETNYQKTLENPTQQG